MSYRKLNAKYRPSKRQLRNLRQWDPFMRPEWRHQRVLELLDQPDRKGRAGRRDDDQIRIAKSFIGRWRKGDTAVKRELLYENPGLWFAYKIYEMRSVDPDVAFMIEARLLANQSNEEIADAVKTIPQTIEWYDALFFNVRPFLRHHDWIIKHVLLPAVDRFAPIAPPKEEDDGQPIQRLQVPEIVRPHLDVTLKFFSYFGGPILCEFMLSGFKRGVIVRTQDEIGDWFDEQFANSVKMRSAQAVQVFEINRYNVMELFSTYARLLEIQSGEDSADEKRTTWERHINAMLTEIPWVAGKQGDDVYEGTPLGRLDKHAAELRDEELQIISAGGELDDLEDLPNLVIPTAFHDDKEGKDANAKPK